MDYSEIGYRISDNQDDLYKFQSSCRQTDADDGSTSFRPSKNDKHPTLPFTCRYSGLQNQGATCYLNSVLQVLYMTPEIREAVLRWKCTNPKDPSRNIACQLQTLFTELDKRERSAVSTRMFTQSLEWSYMDAFKQQDAHECLRLMLEKMPVHWGFAEPITPLFQGRLVDYTKCRQCGNEIKNVGEFVDIQLHKRVASSGIVNHTIDDAMEHFLKPEIVDGYYCNTCNRKTRVNKKVKIEIFPQILCIHLRCYDFDEFTKRPMNIDDVITFKEYMDLTPFIQNNSMMPNEPWLYELFAVLVHSGGHYGGHYFAYIKSNDETTMGQWFKFNDSTVERVVAFSTILGNLAESSKSRYYTSNAYMLFYRKETSHGNSQACPLVGVDKENEIVQRQHQIAAQKKNKESYR